MNRNYKNGANKERRIVNKYRAVGMLGFRSAGSHSPIDVCIIDKETKRIAFIQSKPKSMSENAKKKLEEEMSFLRGEWSVKFWVE